MYERIKLLRIIEGQPHRRVGGQREIKTDVRLIGATNRDLPARIRSGDFREDLYFRLNVFRIEVPPLRARDDDVLMLARFFLERSARTLRKEPLRPAAAVEQMLLAYDWPGNVREVRNVMERAAIVCETDEIGVAHLPTELQASAFVRRHVAQRGEPMPPLAEVERRYVLHVVKSVDGNLSEAARILGIARNTLKGRLRIPTDH